MKCYCPKCGRPAELAKRSGTCAGAGCDHKGWFRKTPTGGGDNAEEENDKTKQRAPAEGGGTGRGFFSDLNEFWGVGDGDAGDGDGSDS